MNIFLFFLLTIALVCILSAIALFAIAGASGRHRNTDEYHEREARNGTLQNL